MADFNKSILVGRLTADPELRYTSGGTAVCNFDLAVNRKYKGSDDELKEETLFQRITVWGKQAENCAQYLSKGRSALVEGRLKKDSYENNDGVTVWNTTVVADVVQFLGGKPEGDSSETSEEPKKKAAKKPSKKKTPPADDDIPF